MSAAFEARCLLRASRAGTLATAREGQPYAGLVAPAVAGDGAVLMLLSGLAEHAKQLEADPRCALMVSGPPENLNPLTAARLTVMGRAERLSDRALHAFWLARHPYASMYADFGDFALWRLRPESGHFVAGFGRIARLDAADLAAPPDLASALSAAEAGIVSHCNEDHLDALTRLAHARGARGHWRMLGVDCDGIDLVQDETVLRVAFLEPVADPAGVRRAMIALLDAAHT